MTSDAVVHPETRAPHFGVAFLLLFGSAIAVALGVYARVHDPSRRPLFTLGFSGMLQMKAWLGTAALALVVVQVLSALWMFGRLGGTAPRWAAPVHRWSGAAAFVLLLPVAFHCMWAIGFGTGSTRVYAHCIAGCALYGAFAAKMLALRIPGLPGWTLPLFGGAVLTSVVLLWLTASLWFFTQPGIPLT
jgi:hypothetical protein